jgi:hypothetical protein
MAPGATATLGLATDRDCDARYFQPNVFPQLVYHQLVIDLPGGSRRVPVPDGLDLLCGLGETRFGMVPPEPPPIPDPLAALQASAEFPAHTHRGDTLRYVVALGNPTDHDIVLDPCPYLQYSPDLGVKHGYSLNCEAVRSIPAGTKVRYAMQLRIPGNAPSGRHRIFWELLAGPSTQGTISIS